MSNCKSQLPVYNNIDDGGKDTVVAKPKFEALQSLGNYFRSAVDYCNIPGKHPLPGKHPCTAFQGINVAASI